MAPQEMKAIQIKNRQITAIQVDYAKSAYRAKSFLIKHEQGLCSFQAAVVWGTQEQQRQLKLLAKLQGLVGTEEAAAIVREAHADGVARAERQFGRAA